jgi:ABC transporter substrate binding protein
LRPNWFKVDLLVTYGTPGTFAAKQATTTLPIVMIVSGDAVATGIVPSLAHPGGNVTGSTFFGPELNAKGVELLKEAYPNSSGRSLPLASVFIDQIADARGVRHSLSSRRGSTLR